jgi:hypothetical protein
MARQKLAWHESGHLTVARHGRYCGAPVVSAEIGREDGITRGAGVSDPRGTIAILMAGGIAEELVWGPSWTKGYGSDEDQRMLAQTLDGLHPACRSQRLAEGKQIALDALREHRDLLEAVAEQLWLKGRWP